MTPGWQQDGKSRKNVEPSDKWPSTSKMPQVNSCRPPWFAQQRERNYLVPEDRKTITSEVPTRSSRILASTIFTTVRMINAYPFELTGLANVSGRGGDHDREELGQHFPETHVRHTNMPVLEQLFGEGCTC
ncbi:hypothetical protein K461DRAFT_316638 [Myriangium duriaei CBS 260.36]|uniref:Uncharacterized protein n=1 Tax=Myriangium duriaei CBS 260.36 TaxID=1168546 RepID=A0A9P4IPJ6_9PEZI|nr:hypothetical protein K461DRAFT_316638 [Myriangium duriaei CBS 260.36]